MYTYEEDPITHSVIKDRLNHRTLTKKMFCDEDCFKALVSFKNVKGIGMTFCRLGYGYHFYTGDDLLWSFNNSLYPKNYPALKKQLTEALEKYGNDGGCIGYLYNGYVVNVRGVSSEERQRIEHEMPKWFSVGYLHYENRATPMRFYFSNPDMDFKTRKKAQKYEEQWLKENNPDNDVSDYSKKNSRLEEDMRDRIGAAKDVGTMWFNTYR